MKTAKNDIHVARDLIVECADSCIDYVCQAILASDRGRYLDAAEASAVAACEAQYAVSLAPQAAWRVV